MIASGATVFCLKEKKIFENCTDRCRYTEYILQQYSNMVDFPVFVEDDYQYLDVQTALLYIIICYLFMTFKRL